MNLLVATAAPLLTCVQLVPQCYETYRNKHVKGLSLYSLLFLFVANVMWFLHGYFIMDLSLLIATGVHACVNLVLLFMYAKYK